MRPLEILLVLTAVVTFLVLAIPRWRSAKWTNFLVLFTLVIASAQALVEGPRWQIRPAYFSTGLFALLLLLQGRKPAGAVKPRGTMSRIAVTVATLLAILALAFSAILPLAIPVFRFPRPTGPFDIGTTTYHWVDSTRPEFLTADPDDRRELMVQVWYPAEWRKSAPRAPYVPDPRGLAPLARLLRMPPFVFGHLKYVTTNAMPSAPVAPHQARYPLLIFAHGRGGFRQHNTQQIEELVSHGYVIAAADHPYAASGVVFPGGRVAAFDPRMFDLKHPGHPAFLDTVIPYLAKDVVFTLDRLAALDQSDPDGILTGRMDLQKVGMFGASLGGAVAAEACRIEQRFKACLTMDVFMPADVVREGLKQPTMMISRDSGSMRLEGWAQADIDETQVTMRAVLDSLPQAGYLVLIPGMFHANYSDAPLLSPLASKAGITGPIERHRGRAIMNAFSLAFFERHLQGKAAELLEKPADRYPEVIFEARRR